MGVVILLALGVGADGAEEWTAERVVSQSNSLESMFFCNARYGFVVGERGTALRTTDGGGNWERLATNVEAWIDGVHFIDESVGWMVAGGNVLSTFDGGAQWTCRYLTSGVLSGVHFVSDREGWVVGDMLLHTVNGGDDWHVVDLPQNANLDDLSFIERNDREVWIAGESGPFRRNEQGVWHSWEWARPVDEARPAVVNSFGLAGGQAVYVGFSDARAFASRDGGEAWARIDRSELSAWPSDPVIHFLDADSGCVSGDGLSKLWTTSDGGRTWTQQKTALDASGEHVSVLRMLDRDTIVACTINGSVWRIHRQLD